MTWQRIDENTYIDDTLVTCAEYQLFIDAMLLDEGKHYQPDHWTSYQFQAGQAREPILGVRHSDAVAFCEWLTKRENKEWKFRLPTQEEADSFPVKSFWSNQLGYWIVSEKYRFVWAGTTPEDAFAMDLGRSFFYARTSSIPRVIVLADEIAHNINFDRDLSSPRDLDYASALARELNSDLTKANELVLFIDIEVTTLQERIAGRSPAFEGIRLVKERIR